jgi:putative methanogenesis marker protein 8
MELGELIEKHRDKRDLHITRVMCAWVVVSEGKVVEIEAGNALTSCPLQSMLSSADIEGYAYEKIRQFGHFTAVRELTRSSPAVPFGASEMLMTALSKGLIDCAITACDGAGTVIATRPEVAQGIGARMNGLFYTSPIPEVQAGLRRLGCTVFDDARIDQTAGLAKALELGHRRVAVTANVCQGERLSDIRDLEKRYGAVVYILGICSTGASESRVQEVAASSDVAWACASKHMRDSGGGALLQITTGIPIFVYTRAGLDFIGGYSNEEGSKILRELPDGKQFLISVAPSETPVVFGAQTLFLREAQLPVRGHSGPIPLR